MRRRTSAFRVLSQLPLHAACAQLLAAGREPPAAAAADADAASLEPELQTLLGFDAHELAVVPPSAAGGAPCACPCVLLAEGEALHCLQMS